MKPTTNYRQTACRLLEALFFLCLFAPVALGQNNPVADDNWQNHVATKIDNDGGGNGTDKDNPILIASAAELAYFAQQVNSNAAIECGNSEIQPNGKGGDVGGFFGYYFALSTDIDLKEHYWTPIGTGNTFKGNFDGKGHCVSGLKVNVNTGAGLFGYANPGTIQNLGVCIAKEGVRGVANRESIYAGGIAGQALNIHNCYVVGEGSIEINGGTASGYAGGIVGYLYDSGSLTNCYATVDIKIEGNGNCYAGGIVGYCNSNSTISCTYATGDVETGTGPYHFYAGGICGYLNGISTIKNSLALNGRITGGDNFSNRIVGKKETNATLSSNYASPTIIVKSKTSPDNLVDNENGANTWLGSFDADLKIVLAGNTNSWGTSWTFTSGYLPQLKKKIADSYEEWTNKQPQLQANLYLPSRLCIVSPTGGTLTVTDDAGNLLTDGSAVLSGTILTLANTEASGYEFEAYLSSSDGSNFTDYSGTTIVMPDHDLYLSVRFKEEQKPDPDPPYIPPVPIYYSVYLPQVEGATTDPGPGEYEVASWDNFRFYLTLDSAYSESQPVVTTDRGETLVPRTSDGAYLVKYVRTDVEVFIDGLFKNPPPVANEAIGTDALIPQIWAEGSMLCIRMAEALPSAPRPYLYCGWPPIRQL